MPKIQRKTQKIFCSSADSDQLAVFGSMATGTPVYSNDVEQLQSNEAYEIGWDAATLEDKAPFMEEMNGMQYAMSYQLAYTLQTGMPEWDAETEYFANTSFCQVNGVIYQSKTDNNIGNNPATDSTNWALYGSGNYLNTSQITNCLLEVPQNIKLELADGVLTLKADSNAIVPNGANNFEHKSSTSDLSRATFGTQSGDNIYIELVVNSSTLVPTGLTWSTNSNTTVGTTAPTSGIFYDTEKNEIYNYTSSSGKADRRSLPVALVKMESGVVTEIKQVFNGIGHFGSVIFADKGIKGLIPNGRNEDGTLNNIEFKTDEVLVHNITENKTGWGLYLSSSHLTKSTAINYDDISNYNIHPTLGNYLYCQIGTFDTSSTNFAVSNFRVKEPFRAVDYNDFKKLHVNNPYFFGMYQWLERDPENLSWLKSNCQWNSGTGYQDFYNWALAKAKAGTSGFALSTASYTDYDFVVNTSAKTFRLPIKVKGRIGEAVVGNGNIMTFEAGYDSTNSGTANYIGLARTNKSGDYGTVLYNLNGNHFNSTQSGDPYPVGSSSTPHNSTAYGGVNMVGLSQNPTYSGLELDTTGLSLYFYVGETVRDEFLINVGEIASNIADKVDAQQASGAGMPSSRRINLTLGATGSTYTALANGYFTLSIKAGTTSSTFIRLQSSAGIISEANSSGNALRATAVYIPVKKDDVVTVTYDAIGPDSVFRFIYAEGEV